MIYLAPDAPEERRERICQWLRANGLDPNNIPGDAAIEVDGDSITTDVMVRDGRGKSVVVDNGVLRGRVTVPLQKSLAEFDLPFALAAAFTPTELALIAPYLTRRAVEARATSRADEAAALRRLGDAVAAAGNVLAAEFTSTELRLIGRGATHGNA